MHLNIIINIANILTCRKKNTCAPKHRSKHKGSTRNAQFRQTQSQVTEPHIQKENPSLRGTRRQITGEIKSIYVYTKRNDNSIHPKAPRNEPSRKNTKSSPTPTYFHGDHLKKDKSYKVSQNTWLSPTIIYHWAKRIGKPLTHHHNGVTLTAATLVFTRILS